MKRRQALFGILGLAGGLPAASELAAQATAKVPIIGMLDAGSDRVEWWAAFRQQLRDLGYVERRNIAFELRLAGGKFERLPASAQELVRIPATVIVTSGTVAARIGKQATSGIPIVMATGDDPVRLGIAASLARPGGNVTGMTSVASGLAGKRFELLREIQPKLARLAVLLNEQSPVATNFRQGLEAAARPLKIPLQFVELRSSEDFAAAFSAMARERASAIFVINDPRFFAERRRIADLAIKYRLPSVVGAGEYVDAGALISYAPSYPDLFRRTAFYVDRILKGAKPGDLPIEQPTKFELVINMKTARALGVKIPPAVLLRAERVIE